MSGIRPRGRQGRRARHPAIAIGLLYLGLLPAAARATIIFTMSPVTTDTNIGHFVEQSDGTSAIGQELGNGPDLLLVATDTALDVRGAGQAFLQAADSNAPFTTATITPAGSVQGFTVVEFNPRFGNRNNGGGGAGSFTLTALDQDGRSFTSQVFSLTSGENRVAAVASDGEIITGLTFQASGGGAAGSLRQFRVTTGTAPVAVPEPSTLASGAVAALIGLGYAWRRRRAKVA